MYNFIYYVMYNFQKSKGGSDLYSRYNASAIIAFVLFTQIVLLTVILKRFFHINLGLNYIPKVLIVASMVIIFMLVNIFYNKTKVQNAAGRESYSHTVPRKLLVLLRWGF
jgi:hypothetical protein